MEQPPAREWPPLVIIKSSRCEKISTISQPSGQRPLPLIIPSVGQEKTITGTRYLIINELATNPIIPSL